MTITEKRLSWCKGYIPLGILIMAAGLYFGIGLARAIEEQGDQVIFDGSLTAYREAAHRASLINGCYGWSEQRQKYMVWKWDSDVCQK